MLGRETIDDIVALATLVTFNGVDRDVVQLRNAQAVDSSTHGSNLIAVRHNDTQRFQYIKIVAFLVDVLCQLSSNIGLDNVHFRRFHLISVITKRIGDEGYAIVV